MSELALYAADTHHVEDAAMVDHDGAVLVYDRAPAKSRVRFLKIDAVNTE